MPASITVRVNDDDIELSSGSTLSTVIRHLDIEPRGTAIALNGEIAARSQWHLMHLAGGDHVEVLTVAQGG